MPSDADSVKGATLARGTARRVWKFARPYRGTIAVFLVAILVAALLALVPPLVTRAILDTAIPEGNRQMIFWLAAAAVAAALGDAALQIVQRWCSARVGEGLIADLRRALFAKVQRMPIAFFTRTPTGAITSRLNNDVIGAQTAVTSTLGSVVSNVIVLITSLLTMLALEWRLTLMALAVLPMFVIPARRVGRRLQNISREQMQHNAAMNTQMTERFNVSGAMLVKLFGDLDRENTRFGTRANAVRDAGIRSAMLGRVFFVALGLVAALGAAAIYGIGALYVVDGDITTGTLVALAALVGRVYQPLTGLTNARVDLMTSMVSFERVFDVLDAPEAIQERPGAVDLVDAKGRVEFDDVVFRYPPASESSIASLEQQAIPGADPDRDILHGVSLTVEPGETLALVGASGAGKSTLASLVPRLYDVTSGAVRLDGLDVRDLTLPTLRRAIGVVSQDPHLFHESIGDNLRYAKDDATRDRARSGLPCRPYPRHDRGPARRLRHRRRRARLPPERRREATHRDRAAAVEGSGGHDPRRGDEPSRQRQRGPRAGRSRGRPARANRDRDRPPPVDRAFGRPHRGPRRWTHRRDRHPRPTRRECRCLRRPTARRRSARTGVIGTPSV